MRLVIQRVTHAECVVEGNVTGAIKDGFLVLAGISDTDDEEMAGKVCQPRYRSGETKYG